MSERMGTSYPGNKQTSWPFVDKENVNLWFSSFGSCARDFSILFLWMNLNPAPSLWSERFFLFFLNVLRNEGSHSSHGKIFPLRYVLLSLAVSFTQGDKTKLIFTSRFRQCFVISWKTETKWICQKERNIPLYWHYKFFNYYNLYFSISGFGVPSEHIQLFFSLENGHNSHLNQERCQIDNVPIPFTDLDLLCP